MTKAARKVKRIGFFPFMHPFAPHFECPVCAYCGPYARIAQHGTRKHALCPCCGALERHRLQCWCLHRLFAERDFSRMRLLHFAPEAIAELLKSRVARYETADLYAEGVDHRVDLQSLPFADGAYDSSMPRMC